MRPRPWSEYARWSILLAAAVLLMLPFAADRLLGGGDMLHYARQLDDFRTQLRAGVFPVMVGQSAHAFNGDIHPLRTAPYFQYFGGLLDLLTGGKLPAYLLLNLVLVLHAVAGVFSAYFCLRALAPRCRWLCLVLALLYLSSPGVLSMIYAGDMVISWMTLPWLPLFFLGLVQVAREPNKASAWAMAAVGLAALWLAHAPIALWSMALGAPFALFALGGLARQGRGQMLLPIGTGVLFLGLAAYEFASVLGLAIPADPNMRQAIARGSVFATLTHGWIGFLHPVSAEGRDLIADLQLSPGLWLAALLGLSGLVRREWHLGVSLGWALILTLVLLAPISSLAGWIWPRLPTFVLGMTDEWPMLRFYVILSALVPFGVAASAPAWSGAFRRVVVGLLVVGLAWSGWEARKFIRHGWDITNAASTSELRMAPDNVLLSRYTYEYYGRLPRYYSPGAADPWLRNRLLDPDTLEPEPDLPAKLTALAGGPSERYDLTKTVYGGVFQPPLRGRPHQLYLLRLGYSGAMPTGSLEIHGPTLFREYHLPSSGEERAFGLAPGNNPSLSLRIPGDTEESVEFKFIQSPGSAPAHLRLEVTPLRDQDLPVEVLSLIPYQLAVRAARPGWVETPKIFLPGYAATVNGASANLWPSPDGLVMVAVPKGSSEVVISYPGPAGLRTAFWVSFLSWIGVAAVGVATLVRKSAPIGLDGSLQTLGRGGLVAAGGAAAIAVLIGGWQALRRSSPLTPGRVVLSCTFPYGHLGASEPLLTIREGHFSQEIYASYEDGKHVRLGWIQADGHRKLSDPIPVNYLARQRLEITLDAAVSKKDVAQVRLNQRLALQVPAIAPDSGVDLYPGQGLERPDGTFSDFTGKIIYLSRPR